jgi:hypothetical protein
VFKLNTVSSGTAPGPLQSEQLEFTFESPHARSPVLAQLTRRDIALMISSYSPNKTHQQWMKSKDEEARQRRTLLSETEKVTICFSISLTNRLL